MKKKSCVWLVCILLCLSSAMEGQVIRLDGGAAFSKLVTRGVPDGYSYNAVRPFQISAGLEYWDKGAFNLSSSIGYLRKGGSMDVAVEENVGDIPYYTKYKDYIDYLTVNTLFNLKRSVRRETYYIGVGPRLDFKLGTSNCSEAEKIDIGPIQDARAVVFGLKCEVGFWFDLTEHYRIGTNFSYLPSFTKAWVSPVGDSKMKIGDRTFTLSLSLGYRL